MTQLSFFNLPPTAEIHAFPPARQRSTIQDVALELEKRKGRARTAFWRQVVAEITLRLKSYRLREAAIEHELREFKAAVAAEIHAAHGSGKRPGSQEGAA